MNRSLFTIAYILVAGCSAVRDPIPFPTARSVEAPEGATAFYDRDVQAVFNRTCTGGCHEPGGTGNQQAGLLLTSEVSFVELLDPTLSKNGPQVIPGDPDNSLLVWKLEGQDPAGRPIFGDQMPLGRTPLTAAEIDAIKRWIDEGALLSTAPPAPPSVLAVVSADSISLEVTFSEPVDPATAGLPENYAISSEGTSLAVIDARTAGEDRVLLTTAPQSPGVAYTLVVRAVKDLSGQEIAEGKGDRFSFRFSPVVSFATQIQPVFDTTCAFVGCHAASEQFPPGEGLVLEAGLSLENLLEVPSRQSASLSRVKPGAPDESYIILKLEENEGILGDRMPQGGPFLTPAQIGRFRLWIEQLANIDE